MTLQGPTPVLYTKDFDATLAFYCGVLGFACAARTDGWASLELGDARLMLSLPNAHEPFTKPNFTGSLYFRCEGVDALWARLRDRAPVVYPIESFDYGMREFAIRDVNGYVLQFGEERA
jgi:uncharacterized glyoxalase superfamily protein PhnB